MHDLKTQNPFAAPLPAPSPRRTASSGSVLVAALLLGIVVLAVYRGGLQGELLGPDHALLNRSPLVSPPASPGTATSSLPPWLPPATEALSLAADRSVWGPRPAGFRTTSVILHWLTSILVLVLGLRWMRRSVAFTAALLFAVHPLHVATVDVAGGRGEILAAFFGLLTLLFLSLARQEGSEDESGIRHGSGPRTGWLVAAFGACLAASFSSPLGLTLPIIVVLTDLLPSAHPSKNLAPRGRDWMMMALACVPAALAGLMLAPPRAPLNRWLTGRALLESLRLLIVPYPLRVYRIIGPARGADALSLLALLAALGVLMALLLLSRRRDLPFPRIALLLAVVPVLALVLLPPAAPGSDVPFPLLEERLYLPSIGACFVLAGLIQWAVIRAGIQAPRTHLVGTAVLVGAVSLVFAVLATTRHPVLTNDVTFYAAAAAESPGSSVLRVQLAQAAATTGLANKGIEILEPILAQRPSDPDLHLLLANLHRDARNLSSAEIEAREALRLRPEFAEAQGTLGLIEREKGNVQEAESAYREAIRLDPNLAEAHNNLGALLASRGVPLEALEEMKKALELDPSLGDAAANLASFLLDQKRPDEAIDVLRQGLRHSEANPRLHYVLGVALQSEGKRRDAENAYRRAIELDPGYARPINNLAILLTEEKKYDEAVALLRRLTELEPSNERAHYNLGIAYRSQGDTTRAAAEFSTALRIRPDYTDASRALSEMLNAPRAPAAGH